ncbi:MAG TPA: hypothetical protein VN894_03705 [Polyangiaceae bacterium]|nr:hypothetical protein [Polyangiaceae bacterium]
MDTPSDPGSAAGASDRRDSGKLPDAGGGGAEGRGGGTDPGAVAPARRPSVPSDVVLAGTARGREGADSVENDGGGTKARRAIELDYTTSEWWLRLLRAVAPRFATPGKPLG